jgi:AcrR family transcriptional regulator
MADGPSDGDLTPERILEAAEDVLRRFGPSKTTVVDVARALGVSHGSVYRHFASKAALRDAVAERWLDRISTPLAKIVAEDRPAPERLRRWFDKLIQLKHQKVKADPEMFATYSSLAMDAREVVESHVGHLVGQVEVIVADGMKRGEFASGDAAATARALFDATARFHHPKHASEWSAPATAAAFEGVWSLLSTALGAGATAKGRKK